MIIFMFGMLGFALLAVGMRRYQNTFPMFKPYQGRCQMVGWVLLTASLIIAVTRPHMSIALVEWFGLMTVSPLPAVIALTVYTRNKNAR